MDDMVKVVLLASLVGACTTTLSGTLQHYFQYILSFIWNGIVRALGIWAVEAKDTSINNHVSAIFDDLHEDSQCRSFTWKGTSWGDGHQFHYLFLPTPTWRSYFLQVCMIGYYAYLPSDPSKKLTMLITKEQHEQLMVAVNCKDAGRMKLPRGILDNLRCAFHADVPSKNIGAQIRCLYGCVRDFLNCLLNMCGFPLWTGDEVETYSEPLLETTPHDNDRYDLEQQIGASDQPLLDATTHDNDRNDLAQRIGASDDDDDDNTDTNNLEQQIEDIVVSDGSSENMYILFTDNTKYPEKYVKPLRTVPNPELLFSECKPWLYVVDARNEDYGMQQIVNQFLKSSPDAELGLYYYDPRTSLHFSHLLPLRSSNKDLNLVLFLPLLSVLEECISHDTAGLAALSQVNRGQVLTHWVNFLYEISNCCLSYISLVLPHDDRNGCIGQGQESVFVDYARIVLHDRVKPCSLMQVQP